jgi:hypothetical protein
LITHQIDGITYHLRADGSLAMQDADGASVDLGGAAMFGLTVFLRLPGAASLIRAAELERQRRNGEDQEL